MSKAGRVKQLKQILGGQNGQNMNEMFSQMIGSSDAELDIIVPKFVQTRNLLKKTYRLLLQFGSNNVMENIYNQIQEHLKQILDFAIALKESVVFDNMNLETDAQYKHLDKKLANQIYNKLKEDEYVKELIVLCGKLKRYQNNFSDLQNLSDRFIGQEPGLDFRMFDFSNLDLKKIWSNTQGNSMARKYILQTFHVLYNTLMELYGVITSPNVDIEQFTTTIIEAIAQLERRPGLERCKNAFKRIRDSVGLLKNRFNDYYRDSVSSENPNLMIENFILDVSNSGSADARLTREFRTIIQYMHKMGQQSNKNKDPAVRALFKMLNQNFELMERKSNPKFAPKPVVDLDDETPEGESTIPEEDTNDKQHEQYAENKEGDITNTEDQYNTRDDDDGEIETDHSELLNITGQPVTANQPDYAPEPLSEPSIDELILKKLSM